MENILLRFPHLGQQIYESLKTKQLRKCKRVGRSWKTFINDQKFTWIRIIQKFCKDSGESLEKILKQSDLTSVRKMATIARKFYKALLVVPSFYSWTDSSMHLAAMSGQIHIFTKIFDKVDCF